MKKALGLPQQLPNERLIKVVGIPTLTQIAGNHVKRSWALTLQRFGSGPASLIQLSTDLEPFAEQYKSLQEVKAVATMPDGHFKVDLRAVNYAMICKELLGLATGAFLTLRHTDRTQGSVGSVKLCNVCLVPSTQTHFLDECPVNSEARDLLLQGVPRGIRVPLIEEGLFSKFFEQLRELEVEAPSKGNVTPKEVESLLKAAMVSSKRFVEVTLQRNSPEIGSDKKTAERIKENEKDKLRTKSSSKEALGGGTFQLVNPKHDAPLDRSHIRAN